MNRRERRAADKAAKQRTVGDAGLQRSEPGSSGGVPSLTQALRLYQNGKLSQAEAAYRAILREAPRDADALYQFGILASQLGRLPEAERCLADAVEIRPSEPAFHHGLGLLQALHGRFADALACHDRALALDAAHIGALAGRAEALHEIGELVAAEAEYRRAASLAPRAPEIRFGWATVLADLGRLPEAAAAYRALLTIDPESAEAHVNLGTVLRDLGELGKAADEFQQALALKPDTAHAVVDLVSTLVALGLHQEALEQGFGAMRRDPASADAREAFSRAVARGAALDYSAEVCGFLERCLEAEDLEHEDLARAAAWQIRQRYGIDGSAMLAARRAVDGAQEAKGCLVDPLLHRLLAGTINTDLELEGFLTEVRHLLCLMPDIPGAHDGFLAALALQGFNNAYVFAVAADEAAHVAALKSDIEAEIARGATADRAFAQKLLRFALYEPLSALADAEKLTRAIPAERSPLRSVIERTLAEPLEEARLGREVPTLGTIENAVSHAVRAQYEAHPYPRWFALPRLSPVSLAATLRRKFPQVPLPAFLTGPLEILVAGCGTGRQPIATALSLRQARVLAVDLSRASLAYAKRMALRFAAGNISFLHADILSLGELGRAFAMIEAVGVLHHMGDPMAGWRVLTGLLRPGGFMRIGLYSAAARADVVIARQRIADLGLEPKAHDIRAFRRRVLCGDEIERLPRLALSQDMFDLNGCRDLLFHTKEHRYTLEQIREMLAALGLEFLGFDFSSPELPRSYMTANPGDPAMIDLAAWARYERAHSDTFAGMYVFWCRKPGQ
jgi:tetratricopeptide (TPR) repeat protein/SAM-dependent methyltransferase